MQVRLWNRRLWLISHHSPDWKRFDILVSSDYLPWNNVLLHNPGLGLPHNFILLQKSRKSVSNFLQFHNVSLLYADPSHKIHHKHFAMCWLWCNKIWKVQEKQILHLHCTEVYEQQIEMFELLIAKAKQVIKGRKFKMSKPQTNSRFFKIKQR